jgi:hypothetical protein
LEDLDIGLIGAAQTEFLQGGLNGNFHGATLYFNPIHVTSSCGFSSCWTGVVDGRAVAPAPGPGPAMPPEVWFRGDHPS